VITHTDWITSVAFSSTGRHLVSGSKDATVQLYDTANGKLPQVYRGHSGTVQTVILEPDNRLIHTWAP
jgi:WD40 repeat protein